MKIDHLKDLTPDPRNARRHNPRNIGMIVDSLHEVGAARSIVIDEDGRILCGNGTVDAAAEAGIEKVQVVDVDGETLVAVRRSGLTESQKTRLALLDNRSAETAEWDAVVLAQMAEDGVKLDDLFCDDELTAILTQDSDMFTPNIAPETSSALVTSDDIDKVRQEMKDRITKRIETQPVTCPYCAGEFYLDARMVKDATGNL